MRRRTARRPRRFTSARHPRARRGARCLEVWLQLPFIAEHRRRKDLPLTEELRCVARAGTAGTPTHHPAQAPPARHQRRLAEEAARTDPKTGRALQAEENKARSGFTPTYVAWFHSGTTVPHNPAACPS